MTTQRANIALTGLQWTLGLVILIEATCFCCRAPLTASPGLTCQM